MSAYKLNGRPATGIFESFFVYAMFCRDHEMDNGYVKVGYTRRPNSRLIELKTACPVPVKVFALIEVGYKQSKARSVERDIHRAIKDRRVRRRGEWYRFNYEDESDKEAFAKATKKVLRRYLGPDHDWWQEINVEAVERAETARRAAWHRKHRRSKEWAAKRERAKQAKSEFEEASKVVEFEDLVASYSAEFAKEIR